ncbi:MAG: hypothetical protein AB8B65_01400 [Kordia sp.]|uniref:hypothetical protein n=1 Tax=Kordia sp. TaxID=1965332 RepID=UPI00385DC1E1
MKKLQIVLIALLTSSLFISCQKSKGVTNADDMGRYAFDILKNLDNVTKYKYVETLFTVDEIKAFGKRNAETLDPKAKKDIDKIEKAEYNERMEKDYFRLKERAKKNNITWNAIEYGDYKFKERDEDGIKGARGKLTFKHGDKTYFVKVTSVHLDGVHRLIRISRLDVHKED